MRVQRREPALHWAQVPGQENVHKAFVGSGWFDATQMDGWLSQTLRADIDHGLEIHFGQDTKLMIGACVRLLSYLHQLAAGGCSVALVGLSSWGLGGYLERMGFFDLLPADVELRMTRSANSHERGQHPALEEIVAIPPGVGIDRSLPVRLSDKLSAFAADDVRESLRQSSFTYFAELLDNVGRHGASQRPGWAALQVYTPAQGTRRMVEVTVADAGAGVLATLRPSLAQHYPSLASRTDEEVLLYAVNIGVSRHGDQAGCGITQSAKGVLRRHEPLLNLRLPTLRLTFSPATTGGYAVTEVRRAASLFTLPGTHWVARYALD